MLRHVVMLRWNDVTTDEEKERAAAGFRALPSAIPQIRRLSCGPDLGIGSGNHDFVAIFDFDHADDWRVYQEHPRHREFIATALKPILADRAAIQVDTE
jgi:hypothetical protein